MPTYQYACTECGEQLEVVQKFTDDPLTECPRCGGALRKVFGSIGIAFKGSGFYRTDSRAASGSGRSGNGSSGDGAPSTSSSTSSGSGSSESGGSSGSSGSSSSSDSGGSSGSSARSEAASA